MGSRPGQAGGCLGVPTIKLYPNGTTGAMGGNPAPIGGKRGAVVGWSVNAVRRHVRWLYGVEVENLTGEGYSLTLTVRDCPETAAEWQTLRKSFLDGLTRSGVVLRTHWLTEWTRRKVPHLHLAIYFVPGTDLRTSERLTVNAWLTLAERYGAGRKGQHIAPIYGALGWLEYLSKHASRGVNHYQRQGSPPGWEKTGRLWGKTGTWPVGEPAEAHISREEFWRFRRLVRSWRVAQARLAVQEYGQSRRKLIGRARRMLKNPDPDLSPLRAVSEWIPEDLGYKLLDLASDESPD